MHIHIHDHITLVEIQEVFSNYYPYLKLEFFSESHKPFAYSLLPEQIPPTVAVQDIKHTHTDGIIDIRPLQTVNQLEQEFQQRLGLPVQVYYQSKGTWMQTAGLDTLSLKELNEISRNDSDSYVIDETEKESEEDYT